MTALLQKLAPYEDLRAWLRGLTVVAVAAFFLTLSGAFGTGDAPLPLRAAYWALLMGAGHLWGGLVARHVFRRWGGWRWLAVAIASVLMATPFTLVVWATSRLMLGSLGSPSALPVVFLYVLVISAVLTAVHAVLDRRDPPPAGAPRFLDRLPLKLRGAEVWAVEAEDHYLRLHTSKGQDLILMRLADAVAELEGLDGTQVHRSWWVARDAIVAARRGDGRASLTLKGGAEVPVSRTYARVLRDRGWI